MLYLHSYRYLYANRTGRLLPSAGSRRTCSTYEWMFRGCFEEEKGSLYFTVVLRDLLCSGRRPVPTVQIFLRPALCHQCGTKRFLQLFRDPSSLSTKDILCDQSSADDSSISLASFNTLESDEYGLPLLRTDQTTVSSLREAAT